MPFYKFKCRCGNEFKKKLSMQEAKDKFICGKCGENATRDFGKVNVDETTELRDPMSPRHWKKNLTAEQQSVVLTGERNPY